jgi:uncharacterized membrane protein
MTRNWKVALVFTGVFLAGAVAGGFGSLWLAKSVVQRRGAPEQFGAVFLQRLDERLKLSPEQRKRIAAIVGETSDELRRLRRDSGKVMQAMDTRVAAELDATQRPVFEDLQRKMRERLKNRPPPARESPPARP